jgi:hypothetical protein
MPVENHMREPELEGEKVGSRLTYRRHHMSILFESITMHVENMGARSISIGIPNDVVILARLEDWVVGKDIAVQTVEGGATAPCRGKKIRELRFPDRSVAIRGIGVNEIGELL